MGWTLRLRLRLRTLLAGRQVERELDDELRYHVDRLIDGFVASGLSREDARRAALREMGPLEQQREACRDARGQLFVEAWLRDAALAVRMLRRSPGFTITTVASLACGVALVAVTLSVINAYLLRALPFPGADRLYHVNYVPQGEPEPRGLATLDWTALADVVEVADSSLSSRFYLTDGRSTQEAQSLMVAPGSLESLGIAASAGRTLTAGDFLTTAEAVAMISPAMWRDRFASDPEILGRTFRASTGNQSRPPETFRIVGILPVGFRYVRNYGRAPVDIVAPLKTPAQTYMVRLRDGVPPAEVERRIVETVRQLPAAATGTLNVRLESVHGRYIGDIRPILSAVAAGAGLVLAIVLVNVAILTLLRTLRRQKEVAVRLALGAANRHIIRLLVAEACVLTGLALAAALALTTVGLGLLAPRIESELGRPIPGGTDALAIDPTVLLMLAGIGVAVALSLSAVPLLMPWQRQLGDQLRRDSRTGTDSPKIRWARSALVAVEMAGTFALFIGCGLMARTVLNIVRTDLGIDAHGVVRSRLALPALNYPDAPALARFHGRFAEELASNTHAEVALTNFPVLAEAPMQAVEVDGRRGMSVGVRAVSPGYFAVLGIAVEQGRAFTVADRLGSAPVAIVSRSLARQLSPAGSAIGLRIRTGEQPVAHAPVGEWRTVVGVVGDVRQTFLDRDQSDIFLPLLQAPNQFTPLVIRTGIPLAQWTGILRSVVAGIDPAVQIGSVTSLDGEVALQSASQRFMASLMGGFAALAAAIALIGIYGVTAYAVQQRQREVAIRMALGADRRGVVRLFMRDSGVTIAAGLVFGVLASIALARAIEHQLFGVAVLDGVTVVVTSLLLCGGGLAATWWPARRAATSSPSRLLNV